MAELTQLCEAAATLGPSQPVTTIPEAEQYVNEPTFSLKKVKLDLPGRFNGRLAALNMWLFEIKQYCQIVGLNKSTDMVKLTVSYLEKDTHTW